METNIVHLSNLFIVIDALCYFILISRIIFLCISHGHTFVSFEDWFACTLVASFAGAVVTVFGGMGAIALYQFISTSNFVW